MPVPILETPKDLWWILENSLESVSESFFNVNMVACARVTISCKGLLSQRMSILRLKVHYGRGVMSSELPKQEVDSWIAANALSHRLSVSSVS